MLEVIKSSNDPKYTLFVPFTRDWLVDEFLEHLDTLAIQLGQFEFIFYNDTNNPNLRSKLTEYLANKTLLNGAALYTSNNQPPTEIDLDTRRQRIVEMKNRSRDLIGNSLYTIGMEDDSFPVDKDCIAKLIHHIDGQENIGFVSGVQRGRHGFSIIGAWSIDNVYDPKTVSTLPFQSGGMQLVEGAGMYLYITPTNLYKAAEYRYEAECLGPDVCYVLDLCRRHYECYVDWSMLCEHRTQNAKLLPDKDCMVVTWRLTDRGWAIVDKQA